MGIELKQVVEALLFATPKPLSVRQILQILPKGNAGAPQSLSDLQEVDEARLVALIQEIQASLESAGHGFILQEVAGGYRYSTRPETASWVRLLHDETKPSRLSQPALETLSIIAYRQPISRADIEAVRGVAVDGVVATLLERRLIKLAGRSEAPGKPLLYETTPEFLETFGLKNLQELPNADELRRIPIPQASVTPVESPAAEVPMAPAPPESDRATDAVASTDSKEAALD